jgi:hypothetical protein
VSDDRDVSFLGRIDPHRRRQLLGVGRGRNEALGIEGVGTVEDALPLGKGLGGAAVVDDLGREVGEG